MGLHVVTGYSGRGNDRRVFNVYTGLSGEEARQAMESCQTATRFHIFANGGAWEKNNPNFKPPADPLPPPSPVPAPPAKARGKP